MVNTLANKRSVRELYASFFLSVALLFPSVNYSLYFAAVCVALFFALFLAPPNGRNFYSFLFLCVMAIGLALPKIFYSLSFSDVKELGKVVLTFAIALLSGLRLNVARIKNLIAFAILFDFVFSLFQWVGFSSPAFLYLQLLMHPLHHIEGSLTLSSVRALGIFSDPAEHAAIVLICYLFFLSLLRHRYWPLQSLFGALLCTVILLITQSKTGLVAFFVTVPIAMYYIYNAFSKIRIALFLMVLILIALHYISSELISKFEQIYFLFEYGMEVSSFAERQLIWSRIFAASFLDAPLQLVLFGVGRGYLESLGYQSSVFDSDVLYILNTYGLIGMLIAASMYFYTIVILAKCEKSVESTWLFLLFIVTPVIGFATDFISSLKVIVLISLIVNFYTIKLCEKRAHGTEKPGRSVKKNWNESACI